MLGFPFKSKKRSNVKDANSVLQSITQKADWTKIIAALLMASFLVLINLSGSLRLPELLVYDKLVFNSYATPQSNHVLLLQVAPQEQNSSPDFIAGIMQRLLPLSPSKIVLMHSLTEFDQTQLKKWLGHEQVMYAPIVNRTLEDGGVVGYQYEALIPSASPLGFALPATSSFGITRSIPLELVTNGETLTGFQSVITQTDRQANPLVINFNQGSQPIPRYNAEKLISVGMIEELVKDKIILITPPLNNITTGLTTPYNNYAEPLSPSLVQAMALNTLINQTDIGMLKPWQTAMVCVLLFFFYLFTFQWLTIRLGIIIIFTSAISLLLIDWYIVSFHYFYLPVFSFIVSIIAALSTAIPLHRITEQNIIETLRFNILSQLKSKKTPHSFYQVEDPWNQIIVFINQHLLLNRSILLERVENDHRVKEIKSLGCSISDIAERRRDYQRYPYDQSLLQQIPLDLENRHYFKESFEGEKQYLIPLRFAEEVLGFWAFTVIPDDNWDQNKFFSNINIFAKQIAHLIHNRKTFNYEDRINRKLVTKLLNFNLGMNNHKSLKTAVDGLDHRLRVMEGIFDGMSSAAILYDLFGQIMSSNQLMDQLALESHLSIYDLTSLDLITQACGISQDEARRRLRHVVMNSASVDLPLADLIESRQYLLRIRSIKPQPQTTGSINDSSLPFELLGILFEFINVTPIQQRFTTDIVAYENLYSILRNDLSSLSLCQLQLSLSPDADQKLMTQISQTLQHSSEILSNAETLLNDAANNQAPTGKLLHPLPLLKRALLEFKEPAAQAKISFNTALPSFTSLIFIAEDALDSLLRHSLNLLVNDAIPDTEIKVTLIEQQRQDDLMHDGSILITMSNSGYGIPQKELAAPRIDTSYIETDALSLFKKAVTEVHQWAVTVDSASEVGSGFEITIVLPVINFYKPAEI
ncbi:sensor histidine kinase [Alkalimarinus alittae]|uniref:CHASE2 domain-containing protein n=1 Tax=Alkalimarinus alittae TaxID=2961619 RepID=A0ABY6MYG8_9ALTE|nr:hypothetical protein [Alkalimarinus alittae]UZE94845.1 hypothetical protein NKI27_12230 [Alkalimarinus alittae]